MTDLLSVGLDPVGATILVGLDHLERWDLLTEADRRARMTEVE